MAGTDAIEYAQAHNDEQFARVEAAQSTVEDSTGIEAIDIPRLDASPQDNNQIAENNNNTDNNNNAERETSEEVKISGFGVFQVKSRKSRTGTSPVGNHEKIVIPATKTIGFKPSKGLKQSVK